MVIQSDPGGGNTRPPTNRSECSDSHSEKSDPSDPDLRRVKKANTIAPSRRWIFTWHNYPENWLSHFAVHQQPTGQLAGYHGGREVCPETKRPHIQGWIDFGCNKKGRPSQLKLPKQIHWKVMRGTPAQNYSYCSKDGQDEAWGTALKARPYSVDIQMTPWMTRLVSILEQPPDSRSIWWIWEPIGKAGKTTFQKWYALQHPEETLVLSGKAHDMKNGIVKFKEESGTVPRVIMCNVPRSTEERYISWQGLEEIKDMLFYSGKYGAL